MEIKLLKTLFNRPDYKTISTKDVSNEVLYFHRYMFKKKKPLSVFIELYKREWWENEKRCVSIAFSSSPKLSQVFL
jgi:hypothetical protein